MSEDEGITCPHVSSSAVDADKTLGRLQNPVHWACQRVYDVNHLLKNVQIVDQLKVYGAVCSVETAHVEGSSAF